MARVPPDDSNRGTVRLLWDGYFRSKMAKFKIGARKLATY